MDGKGFTERAIACERKLYRVARTYLSNESDCEDALQEALIKGWAKKNSLRELRYFDTWLIRILINECRNIQRTNLRVSVPLREIAPPPSPNPELWNEIFSLETKYRIVIVLYYIEGYGTGEIASMLRLPAGTVKWRLQQARKLMKENLKEVYV